MVGKMVVVDGFWLLMAEGVSAFLAAPPGRWGCAEECSAGHTTGTSFQLGG